MSLMVCFSVAVNCESSSDLSTLARSLQSGAGGGAVQLDDATSWGKKSVPVTPLAGTARAQQQGEADQHSARAAQAGAEHAAKPSCTRPNLRSNPAAIRAPIEGPPHAPGRRSASSAPSSAGVLST